VKTLITIALLSTLSITASASDDPMKKAVEARQGFFKLLSANMGPLAAMAKGEAAFDSTKATLHAANIEALAKYDVSIHFPEGTSAEEIDSSDAKPEIWLNLEDFLSKYENFKTAAPGAAEDVKGGRGDLGKVVQRLGRTCKGCHDDYRNK
jgi:cytochrome c556